MDDVYYRIYVPKDKKAAIVEMQWFDEGGYDQERFLTKQVFDSAEDARLYCLKMYGSALVPSHIKSLIGPLLPMELEFYTKQTRDSGDSDA